MLLNRHGRGQRARKVAPDHPLHLRILFTLAGLMPLTACGAAAADVAAVGAEIVTLWTDTADIAAYVEAFNVASERTKVELVFQDAQEAAFGEPETTLPDLALGRFLNTPVIQRRLAPLDGLFRDGAVEESRFYRQLLQLGKSEARQLALPFSFNVPVVVFRKADQTDQIDRYLIDAATLRTLGTEYVAGSSAGLTRIGFSPLWNVDFLVYLASIPGAGLYADTAGDLVVDTDVIDRVTTLASEWIAESHGGMSRDDEFVASFFHQPLYQLAIEGRIRFYLSDIASYFAIPDEKRQQLDFRWLAVDGLIPVASDVRWLVQPEGGRNGTGVRAFLAWILDPQIQEELLGEVQFKRLRVFGLTDGLSSLPEVNERIFPRFHEFLLGRLPERDQLRFLGPMPAEWDLVSEEVVAPWLAARVAGVDRQLSLVDAVAEWRRDLRLD